MAQAAAHFAAHTKAKHPASNKPSLLDAINPFAMLRRRRASKLDAAIMAATLPAFPNENALSSD